MRYLLRAGMLVQNIFALKIPSLIHTIQLTEDHSIRAKRSPNLIS